MKNGNRVRGRRIHEVARRRATERVGAVTRVNTGGLMDSMTEFLFAPGVPNTSDFHLVVGWLYRHDKDPDRYRNGGSGEADRTRRDRVLRLLADVFLPPCEMTNDSHVCTRLMLHAIGDSSNPGLAAVAGRLRGPDAEEDMGRIMCDFVLALRAEDRIGRYCHVVAVMLVSCMKPVDQTVPGAVERLDFLRGRIRDLIGDDPYLDR